VAAIQAGRVSRGQFGDFVSMSKVFRYGVLTTFLGLLFSTFTVADARAQNILGEILRRMDLYNKTLQSLQAEVTMVKYNPQLNVSDISIGTTSYLPKAGNRAMYVRIDWTKPVDEQMSVIGENYELYRPRLNQVIVGKTSNAQNNGKIGNALGFMNMSKAQLNANYDVNYIDEEQIKGGVLTWHLQLNPKTATSYKAAEIWVDGDGMPRQAKITERNNDTTTVLLANIRKNVTLKGEIFKLKYPGTVKKIRA
jgi:outer membrane lipoprotein-sorting protein